MKKENEKDFSSDLSKGKYESHTQLPDDILYEDFRFYRKDKKLFSVNSSGREVHPLPTENGYVK